MNGRPAIPADVRGRIIAAADGMPLYLELSVEHFDELITRGEDPNLDEFGTGLPQLVVRMTRDLSESERSLLRVAALVRAFDRNLLRKAAPQVGDAAIQRFLARAFVRGERDGWLKYSIHDVLRESVVEFDHETVDAWSTEEWRAVAWRVIGHLHTTFADSQATVAASDSSVLSECFMQGVILASHFGFHADWLIQVALALRAGGRWEPLEFLNTLNPPNGSGFGLIREACLAICQRGRGQLSLAETYMRPAVRSITCAPHIRNLLILELGEVLLRQNRDAEAWELLSGLTQATDHCGKKAVAWQAVICERRGDFELAAEWTRVARLDPEMHWFAINLHGHLLLASGRFGEAAREFRRSRFAAVQQGLAVDEIDSIQDEAWAAGFAGAENAGQLAAEAISLSGRVIGAGSVARARSRLALTMLGQADPEVIKDQLRQSVAGLEDAGYHSTTPTRSPKVAVVSHSVTAGVSA